MGAFVAWLGVCVVVALIGLSRPRVPIIVALLLLGLVPATASDIFTGVAYDQSTGLPSLHPGSWVVVIAAGVTLVFRPMRLLEPLVRVTPWVWLLWLFALGVALSTTLISRGSQGLSQLVETLVAPPLLALLVVAELRARPGWRRTMLLSLQWYGMLVAVLAVLEGLLRVDLVWAGNYAQEGWHVTYGGSGFRATVFGGHPLNTAMVLVALLPIMRMRVSERFRPGIPGAVLALAGIAATGSRSALAIAVVYLLVVSFRSLRTAVPTVVTLTALIAIVEVSSFGQRWLDRLSTDTNSSYVRFGALSEVFDNLGDFFFNGRGVGYSGEVSRDLLGQAVSFENGFLMVALDVGIVATVAFVVAMVALAFRGGRHSWSPVTMAFCMVMVMCAAYSSFGTKSPAGFVPWLLAALAPAIAMLPRVRLGSMSATERVREPSEAR